MPHTVDIVIPNGNHKSVNIVPCYTIIVTMFTLFNPYLVLGGVTTGSLFMFFLKKLLLLIQGYWVI